MTTVPRPAHVAPGPAPPTTVRPVRRVAGVATPVLVVAALIALAAWRIDLSAVADRLVACRWPYLLAACAANALSAVAKAVTWRGLLVGVHGMQGRLRRLDLVSPLLVGALVNSGLPGRVGEVAKVVLARRRVARRGGEASVGQVAGSIAAEHLVSTLAWAGVAVALVVVLPTPGGVRLVTVAAAAGCLVLTCAAARFAPPPRLADHRRGRLARGLADCWAAVHQGLRALRRPRALASVSAAAVGQWVAQWAAILLTLEATGLGHVGPAAAGLVLVTLTLAHAVPLSPGGVGTFQIAAMLPLTAGYGVDPAAALAFGVLLQISETAVGVCLGLLCLVRENLAQVSAGAPSGSGSRRTTLRNAMRSSTVLRASRAGRM